MNKKLIIILSSMILLSGLTGCKQQGNVTDKGHISKDHIEIKEEDLKIVEWSHSEKEKDNPEKNKSTFMGDITSGGLDSMSKKSVNIKLKKGQSLRVETETNYPITVMLKDNSNEEYLYNKTSTPVDGKILVDAVEKDGEYELMLDFNEVDEFSFEVYIVNSK